MGFSALAFFPEWLLKLVPFGSPKLFYSGMNQINSYTKLAIEKARKETEATDMIGMMAQLKDDSGNFAIEDQLIVDEAKTIMFAGRDTSSNTLAWTLCFLCQNPELQVSL